MRHNLFGFSAVTKKGETTYDKEQGKNKNQYKFTYSTIEISKPFIVQICKLHTYFRYFSKCIEKYKQKFYNEVNFP